MLHLRQTHWAHVRTKPPCKLSPMRFIRIRMKESGLRNLSIVLCFGHTVDSELKPLELEWPASEYATEQWYHNTTNLFWDMSSGLDYCNALNSDISQWCSWSMTFLLQWLPICYGVDFMVGLFVFKSQGQHLSYPELLHSHTSSGVLWPDAVVVPRSRQKLKRGCAATCSTPY